MNAEVQTYVQQVVSDGFMNFLEQNSSAAKKIIQKCLTSARAGMLPAKHAILSSENPPSKA
jgi:DNA gyrase/topoisomerase IV subunit B